MLKIIDMKNFEKKAAKAWAQESSLLTKAEDSALVQVVNIAKARIIYFITAEAATEAGFNERILRNVYGLEGALRNAPGKSALYNKLNLAKWIAGRVDIKEVSTLEDVESEVNPWIAGLSYSQFLNSYREEQKKKKAPAQAPNQAPNQAPAQAPNQAPNQAPAEVKNESAFDMVKSACSVFKHYIRAAAVDKPEAVKAELSELIDSAKEALRIAEEIQREEAENETKTKTKTETKTKTKTKNEAKIVKIAA